MPFINTLGSFKQFSQGSTGSVVTGAALRYVTPPTTTLWMTFTSTQYNGAQHAIDSTGNIYYALLEYYESTGPSKTIGQRTITLHKYDALANLVYVKNIVVGESNYVIYGSSIFQMIEQNGFLYIVCEVANLTGSERQQVIKINTTTGNVVWSLYINDSFANGNCAIVKNTNSNYVYVSFLQRFYILNDSNGVITNSYTTYTSGTDQWRLGFLNAYQVGQGSVLMCDNNATNAKISGGKTIIQLNSTGDSVTSVSARQFTDTTNTQFTAVAYNPFTQLMCVAYKKTSPSEIGLATYSFNGTLSNVQKFTFSVEVVDKFVGFAFDANNIYVTALSTGASGSFVFKFDNNFNLQTAIKNDGGPGIRFSDAPIYYDNSLYFTSLFGEIKYPTSLGNGSYNTPIGNFNFTPISGTVTRTSGTLNYGSPASQSVTTYTATTIAQTLTSVNTTNKLSYTGL